MSYTAQTKQVEDLNADGIDKALAHLDSTLTKSFQLKVHNAAVADGDICKIQLEDMAVNVIETNALHIHDYSDPYADPYDDQPTQYADLHLFFPRALANGDARQFIVKLSMQDNITVYFHEFSSKLDIQTAVPQILFDTSEEFLGNSMMHCFIETTHNGETAFYMKSRNCVDVAREDELVPIGGIWTLKHFADEKTHVAEIPNYAETSDAKVWFSGDDLSQIKTQPYLLFDKCKNVWIVSDASCGYAVAWQSAASTELSFPSKRAKASWKEA